MPQLQILESNRLQEIDAELYDCFVEGCEIQIRVGRLMQELIDHPLYLEGQTFDAYCEQRWGIAADRGRKWAEAARVADALTGDRKAAAKLYVNFLEDFNQGHAAALTGAPTALTWSKLKEAAPSAAAKAVEKVYEQLKENCDNIDGMTKPEELAHLQNAETLQEVAVTAVRGREIAERTKRALARAFRAMREERYAKMFAPVLKHADKVEVAIDEFLTSGELFVAGEASAQ